MNRKNPQLAITEFEMHLAALVKHYRDSGKVCLGCLNQALILEVARNIEAAGGLDWCKGGESEVDLIFALVKKMAERDVVPKGVTLQ